MILHEPVKNFNFLKFPYGDCSQWFGESCELYSKYGSTPCHNGLDIVRPWGEHLFAPEDGVVASTKEDPGGYGKNVRLLGRPDDNGVMRDWALGHLSYINVKPGQRVFAGQYVGNMGSTGFVVSGNTPFWDVGANKYQGVHEHLGVRDVVHDGKGWKYEGYDRALRVLDYDNGYKGRYDPVPLFAPPRALMVARIADARNSKVLWQLADVLRIINT